MQRENPTPVSAFVDDVMRGKLSRREVFRRGAALGIGAAMLGPIAAMAQATPGASPAAESPESKAFFEAQDALIKQIQGESGKKLKMLSAVVGGKTPDEDKLWADEFKRLTNVTLDLVHPTSDYDQKLLSAFSSGEKYDLIYTNQDTVIRLQAQGALTDLTDKTKSSKILSNPTVIPPDEYKLIAIGDKYFSAFQKFEGARMPTVRQDWMEKLGLQEPKTIDDFYNVMVAFRDKDPDGNGKADTYGLSMAGTYDIQPFMSGWGIIPGLVEVDGKKTIPYATEAAVPAYEWFAKLYKEKLLDPNFATNQTADMRNLFLHDRVGMVTYWDTWVGLFNNQRLTADPKTTFQAKGIPGAVGPDGKIVLNRGEPSVWVIPVNANDPTTAFQIIEWWNTFPGIILGSLGIKGHDYNVSADGKYTLTEIGKEHGMDHGDPTPYNTNWHNPVGELPGVAAAQKISVTYGYLMDVTPTWATDVQPILDEFTLKAILGQMSASDAVSNMQKGLKAKKAID